MLLAEFPDGDSEQSTETFTFKVLDEMMSTQSFSFWTNHYFIPPLHMRNVNEITSTSDAVMRVVERHWPDKDLPRTLAAEVRTAVEVCLAANETPSITPGELAKYWGVSHDKVLNWIRNGQLKAINVASSPNVRPRYRITEEGIADFQRVREENAQPKVNIPKQRRRKPVGDVIEFF